MIKIQVFSSQVWKFLFFFFFFTIMKNVLPGGLNHSESDLAETGELSVKKRFAE